MADAAEDFKARFAAIAARVKANRAATTAGVSAVAKFKARIEQKREESRRLKIRYAIPLNELTGDQYTDEAKLRALKDDAFNWVTEAVIVVGQHQLCSCCGYQANATAGFYLRQQHVSISSSKRLKHVSAIPEGYAIEIVSEGVVLPRCINCMDGEKRVDDLLAATLYDSPLVITNQLSLDL